MKVLLIITLLSFIGIWHSDINEFSTIPAQSRSDTTHWECISIPVDYTSDNKPNCGLDIMITKDSIIGQHCFVSNDGNFIECCIDSPSLRLGKTKHSNQFYGRFYSCYDTVLEILRSRLLMTLYYHLS